MLNAGSLPAALQPEPISQQRIGSQLGDDTIHKGTMAIIISTAAILVFMVIYYRFCGIVADIAVMLNMIVTVALMILIKAAFTLPGLAGLVLTVGMAVDANVLIYERMREETERGASLRMAIRNGFSRAMATIIDSHVTTLVSTAVLYVVGTDQIKGFAVTLIIGLLMSLFTAVFVARVIFDIAEKRRWITQLKMMHVIGHTNIDFIRWRVPAIAGSVIICVLGFIAMASRGQEMLDIDFTGGSSVQLLFAEDKPHVVAEGARSGGRIARRGRQQRGRQGPRIQGRHVRIGHQESPEAAPAEVSRLAANVQHESRTVVDDRKAQGREGSVGRRTRSDEARAAKW